MTEMRHLLRNAVAASGLLLLSLTASAQYQPPENRQYQSEREAREFDRLFDRVRSDLDRAYVATLPFTEDRSRVNRAREEVNECQHRMAAGDYDRRQFDEAIVAIERVVDVNRLSERNRQYLSDDLRQLRDWQSQVER